MDFLFLYVCLIYETINPRMSAIKSQSICAASVMRLRLSARYAYNVSIINQINVPIMNYIMGFDFGFYVDTFKKSNISSIGPMRIP